MVRAIICLAETNMKLLVKLTKCAWHVIKDKHVALLFA